MADERQLSTQTSEALSALEERFPGTAQPAEFTGLVIDADQLVDVATFLRDEIGYAYLSCVTGLDYPEATNGFSARYEVAYNLYRSQGGPLTLHVHADRDDPVVPSLVEVWPSASFQEREAWDLMGIRFEGHPDLRRILLWEGFEGHPLRKDWHEPYYEADQKPFRSRFPKGDPVWAEERTDLERNLRYPEGWMNDGILEVPEGWESEAEDAVYLPLEQVAAASEEELRTDRVVLNIGPQHPSTHGVLRMVGCLDGETVCELEPVLGYLHRNHEKIGERNLWLGNMPYTGRLDYITSMYNNFGYAIAVEKLMDVEVPERAEYIRVIMGELTRVMNHLVSVGFLCNDLGIYFTGMLYALEEREFIIDLFEMASGSRMMCNYFRFGGVVKDLPDGFIPMARELVFERFPRRVDEMETFVLDNEVFRGRTVGIGVLPPEAAVAYGCTGPLLRGSGVPYDVRRAEPYSIYDEFDWDVVAYNNGDVYDRVLVRFGEIRESLRILRQALDRLPDGPIQGGRVRPNTRVPEGEAYGRVEHPKGELGYYVVSDGGANPYRYHIRTPSFVNLGVLGELCRGTKIADVMAILGSIDITLGEVDR
jgi:NADH:ubiquinone oxidoreductase subunit D/NADH:ubiquinone oxidoreductase subunit C